MTLPSFGNRRGLSLIEMAVTLALIGLLSTMAVIYISAGETSLRSSLHNLRFDVERAKNEAVVRNARTYVDFYTTAGAIDCNGNGDVDARDRCYVVFEDLNGNQAYDPEADPTERIHVALLDPSVRIPVAPQLSFFPLGGGQQATVQMESAVRNNCDPVTDDPECLVTAYDVTLLPVGRVHVGDKQERCEPVTYCP